MIPNSFQSYLPLLPTAILHCRQTFPLSFHPRFSLLLLFVNGPCVQPCVLNHANSPKPISNATTSRKPFQMFPVICALSLLQITTAFYSFLCQGISHILPYYNYLHNYLLPRQDWESPKDRTGFYSLYCPQAKQRAFGKQQYWLS